MEKPMAIASLSPNSVLASPIQVNQQAKTDPQSSVPQVAQDAQKTAKATLTDTVTISLQALNRVDNKNVSTKGTATNKTDEQKTLVRNIADGVRNGTQRNALKTYGAVSAIR
jgi:hypothetical protein